MLSKTYKRTPEQREKMSKAHIGKKHLVETRIKMSNARIGIKLSQETKDKISKQQFGKNNPNWKGGITILNQLVRTCYKYRQWRSDVFTRDSYTCQFCGIRGGVELNADHIKPLTIILKENNITTIEDALVCEELWNINNGRTLCVQCHRTTDTYGIQFKP